MISQFDKWHHTRLGLLFFALIELALAAGFTGLSIDRGNPFWYLLALIFLIGSLQNLFKLMGNFLNNGKRRQTS